jgi:hypothetical protein
LVEIVAARCGTGAWWPMAGSGTVRVERRVLVAVRAACRSPAERGE